MKKLFLLGMIVFLMIGCRNTPEKPKVITLEQKFRELGFKAQEPYGSWNLLDVVRPDKNGFIDLVATADSDSGIKKDQVTTRVKSVAMTNVQAKSSYSINLAAKFLGEPIAAGFKAEGVASVIIKFGAVLHYTVDEVSLKQLFIEDKELFNLLRGQLLDNGQREKHYIMSQILEIGRVEYAFKKADGGEFVLKADKIKDIVGDVGIDSKWQLEGEKTLVFNGQLNIAYRLIDVERTAPVSSSTGSSEFSYSFKTIERDDIELLFKE